MDSRRIIVGVVLLLFVLVLGLGVALAAVLFRGGVGGTGVSAPAAGKAGTLTTLGADPPTLDPALAGDVDSASYIVEIFSGLVTLNKKLQIEPDIAERWQVSPDGKVYTFYLRPGVKFQDGKPVTARDFKWAMERAADPRTESILADTYLGDIIGIRDMLQGRAKEASGIKVIDDTTLQLTIDAPKAYFLAKMTYPTAFVLDKDNVQARRNWTDRPNGTGPFRLKEWKKGEKITLERNSLYYREVAKLERVNFLLAGGSSMTMYENNEIDIAGVGLADIDRAMDPSNALNKELTVTPELNVGYIGFNVKMPPFDDVKVRQALTYAVDKEKVISVVLRNLVEPARGILPPGMPGYDSSLKGLGFDVAKAKALLADSKYKDNLPIITISIPGTGATLPPTSEAIIEMWKTNLGLKVEIQQVEWATYLDDLKKHRFQAFEVGWVADYPDPQNFLDILFHCNSLENNSQYCNSQVDGLLNQAGVEIDPEKRIALYRQAEKIIVDDAAWIPLWHGKSYLVIKPWVKDYFVPPMVIPILKDVHIEGR
ncbi:MAG: peptide ABC transporter substrate-binding protein [Chloroflexi bacterium]|nr:peptide ABC transporter substrate-binding protein [Chloroflexota bacterium]